MGLRNFTSRQDLQSRTRLSSYEGLPIPRERKYQNKLESHTTELGACYSNVFLLINGRSNLLIGDYKNRIIRDRIKVKDGILLMDNKQEKINALSEQLITWNVVTYQ